ncbi:MULTISPECIES: EAL domain-containing protein [Sphingomonas]|uniref:EAL domain-containing protein n=1 Tax=Sphingomonas TaxID=13687 RepID=UPI0017FCE540|nr:MULTISPECIES: EAL domain-containing protein [Sphingomonas]MBB4047075.1 EAL domain-containing protein (putative c-di-GMP-specific phosphodiesterase class I) [Sphingomonas zeae]MDK8186873.1 EAL domain-containing protein [Sphingomonas zeae]MDK8214136.1 EAL domain-containing protein [Sphingomonas sp. UMB7805-LC452B]
MGVGNFTLLRRRLGRALIGLLIDAVADRLAQCIPDAIARPTAPAQVEVMIRAATREALDAQLLTIAEILGRPFALPDGDCCIEPVLGAAIAALPHDDDIRLLEEAERALADAQVEGRLIVREMTVPTGRLDRIALAHELTCAIAQDGLFVEYQPKVHVRQQRVASVEALLRWRHPSYGLISPVEFIPVAEESRIIGPLTLWILRQVIADQRRLAAAGHALRIFINISGMLLGDPHFVREACALVIDSGACIGFEITETSVIRDPDSAMANLQAFVDMGIAVAIDDYGAGLSSLSYLKQLPACELKIDKLFITQLTSSNRDPLIVRSTIDLAHALEMEVVAEGVETPATLALLSVMGCDMIQGYLISRPIGFDALIRFLNEQAHAAATALAKPMPLARLVADARG